MEKEDVYYVSEKVLNYGGAGPVDATYSVILVAPETAKELMKLDKKIRLLEARLEPLEKAVLNAENFGARAKAQNALRKSPKRKELDALLKRKEALCTGAPCAQFTASPELYATSMAIRKGEAEAIPSFKKGSRQLGKAR